MWSIAICGYRRTGILIDSFSVNFGYFLAHYGRGASADQVPLLFDQWSMLTFFNLARIPFSRSALLETTNADAGGEEYMVASQVCRMLGVSMVDLTAVYPALTRRPATVAERGMREFIYDNFLTVFLSRGSCTMWNQSRITC